MIQQFLAGITSYARAFSMISSLRLWSFFFIPALISLVLAGIIFGTAWQLSDDIGFWVANFYPWETGRQIIEKISSVFGGLLVGAVGLILYKNLVMALASPFMSKLSAKIEKNTSLDHDNASYTSGNMLKEIIRGLRIAVRNIIREIFFTVLLLLLGLIPIFSPFVAVFIFIIQAYYAGFGSMDYTLERHYNFRNSVRFVKSHRGLAIGNGTVFVLLLMTGIGFLVALPLSTVAATPEVVKRLS